MSIRESFSLLKWCNKSIIPVGFFCQKLLRMPQLEVIIIKGIFCFRIVPRGQFLGEIIDIMSAKKPSTTFINYCDTSLVSIWIFFQICSTFCFLIPLWSCLKWATMNHPGQTLLTNQRKGKIQKFGENQIWNFVTLHF